MGEEASVGGEWFLREQEGMGGKGWPEEGRSLLCDRGKYGFTLLQELMVLICTAVRSWDRQAGKSSEVGGRVLAVGTERRRHPLGYLGRRQCTLAAT